MALGIDGKVASARGGCGLDEAPRDRLAVAHRFDGPGERHDIAPIAIATEQGADSGSVVRLEGGVQAFQPVANDLFRITAEFDIHGNKPRA